ncbi:MAG: hypothetical protein HDR08_07425 [Lachnospiraceae bacterium]|nr:hypothetical protein [Lachnospiraceae bacterium]
MNQRFLSIKKRAAAYLQKEGRTGAMTVEEMTVVYFVMDKAGAGKRKRRGSWQYRIETREKCGRGGSVSLCKVYLPACSYKKKPWKEKDRSEYIQGLEVPSEGRNVCYFYEEEAKAFLGRKEEPLSLEGLLFLIWYRQIVFDSLIILQDRELETEELLAKYVRDTRYIGVVTGGGEELSEAKEELLEEYGFLLDISTELTGLHIPPKGSVLIVAGEELYGITPLQLPKGAIFVSTVVSGAAKKLCARAKEIRYIDMKCLLQDVL